MKKNEWSIVTDMSLNYEKNMYFLRVLVDVNRETFLGLKINQIYCLSLIN
jgi:hypothetical protein